MTPEEQAAMMELMGVRRGPSQNVLQPANFSDPAAIDWGRLASDLGLTDAEVQELQVPGVPGGPSLEQRIEALRPNLGGFRMGVDGNKITGSMRY